VLCVAAEYLFASAMKEDLPTLDDVASRTGFTADRVQQIGCELEVRGPAVFSPIDDEPAILPRRRVMTREILLFDPSGAAYGKWMNRLASLDGEPEHHAARE
jgi:hypothetical protein